LNRRLHLLTVAAVLLAVTVPTPISAEEPSAWKYRFEPADGITAAGQPSAQNLTELADSGYAAVIDLRTAGEERGIDEQGLVESLGMDYVSLPIAGRGAISFENARKLDEILDKYDEPVLVHCGSSNRVGALFALREKMNGANDDDALIFGRSAGMTSLESTVKTKISESLH